MTSTRALAATLHRRHAHITAALAALPMPRSFRNAHYRKIKLPLERGYDIEMTRQGYLMLVLGLTTPAAFRMAVAKEFAQ